MGKWIGVVTNGGSGLLAGWIAGTTLNFDAAAAGTGTVPAVAMMAQTALAGRRQTASATVRKEDGKGVKVRIQITAPQAGYLLNQFGIWASLDGGESVLLALFQTDEGIPIPSSADSPDFVYTFYGIIAIENTGSFTVTTDMSALVTTEDMEQAIAGAVAGKQDRISASGLLKGDGAGGVTAASPGEDYGLPLASGTGAPTEQTAGAAGQHYYDSDTGAEYVCTGKTEAGAYQWRPAGAGDAGDIKYGGKPLDEALNGMKPLSGAGDPTGDTVGAVGQRYVNTESGEIFTYVSTENQDYVWKAEGAAETAKKLSTARSIQVNLGSTAAASFDGSANVTPGVTGTLPVARGGTGATAAAAARTNLGACAKVAPVTVNVPLSWSGSGPWTQTITVSGVTAADEHLGIFPAPVSDAASRKLQYAAYACLSPGNCETQAGKIKLVCDDKKPTVAFQIILKGVR